ncbi:hepatocyte cell adhesion molecule-like [Carcharodon carcharias]|uniref:hepatocyte cell adhesion molecule-like n=1 Tax=Carcharodon carcharias TaxID=13397 RepID=UPI001B7E9A05|nr:hepatocyte cell adhesion molecule-like [Carcharodon carcharias]
MRHSRLQLAMALAFWLAGAARGVEVRLSDPQLYGIVGQPLRFDAEYTRGSWRDIHSVTWKVQTATSLRIFQYIMESSKMYLSPPYRGRVTFHRENGSMVLLNFTARDNGLYHITVTDTEGSEQIASTRVWVYEPISKPVIETFRNHLNLMLTCSAHNGTDQRYHWLKDGQSVVETHVLVVSDGRNLSLLSHSTAMCGVYTCLVTNKVSQESVNKTLSDSHGFAECREKDNAKRGQVHAIPIVILVCVTLLILAACIFLNGKVNE